MADFYPLLSRAVSKLPVDGPHERQELYDKARAILLAQLHGTATAPSLVRQQASLEAAIRRIEAEIRVEIVRRGPLSRAINLAADDDFVNQSDGRRAVSKPFPTTSFERPRQDQASAPPGRDFRPRFDIGIFPHDQEAHAPEEKAGNAIGTEPHAEPSAACDALANGYEDSLTLANGRGKIEPTVKAKAKFHDVVGIPRPISMREILRPPEQRAVTQNIKKPEPLLRRLSVIIILTAGMTLIVILSAIIVFPFVTRYAGRLIWFSEHLFDNPAALRTFLIGAALILLMSFPLIHFGRKKLRRTLARR